MAFGSGARDRSCQAVEPTTRSLFARHTCVCGIICGYSERLASAVVAVAFVFGGLMFGPDLDTVSRQYSRWGIFRAIWFPYRSFFKHRSRFSHGLIFGALLRAIYFMGIVTLVAYLAAYVYVIFAGGRGAGMLDVAHIWALLENLRGRGWATIFCC